MSGPLGRGSLFVALVLLAAACGPDGDVCGENFTKVGNRCKRKLDASSPVLVGDGAVDPDDDDVPLMDAATGSPDSGVDAAREAGIGTDAAQLDASVSNSVDAQATIDGAQAVIDGATPLPVVECDATKACPTAGYQCINNKCSATCAQTQCDPHATCGMDGNQRPQCVCSVGYTGNGTTCTPVSCPTLQAPLHGSVSRTQGTYLQDATYACESGYDLSGTVTRRCEANGKWTATEEPTCVAKSCTAPLSKPDHGSVVVGSGKYPDSAQYFCDTGFTVQGNDKRQCQANGQWAGAAPKCSGCGDGDIDPGEDCEPNATNAWTCASNCKKKTAYLWCTTNEWVGPDLVGKECVDGNYCLLGQCLHKSCSTANDCPSAPSGKQSCRDGVCYALCDANADCPAGMMCTTVPPNGGAPFKMCTGCGPNLPCPQGLGCVAGPNLWGVCR